MPKNTLRLDSLDSSTHETMRLFSLLQSCLLLSAVTALLLINGCSSDESPSSPDTGFQAKGLALQLGGTDLVVIDGSGVVLGQLELDQGTMLDLSVFFILADGTRGVPTTADHALIASSADPRASVATVPWRITLSGLDRGSTSITIRLTKGGTTIYTSPAIPVVIKPVYTSLQTGDTVSYSFRDRDTNNAPSGPPLKRDWFVLRTGATVFGRDNVTEILEIQYDASGVTEFNRDTIYYSIAGDGSVYQYNLLHDLLMRIEQGAAFIPQVPDQWVKLTNTQAAAGTIWSAITPDSIKLTNISLSGSPLPVDVVFRMNASHDGSSSMTTPAGTFTGARTRHTLQVRIALSGSIPIQVLNDSVNAQFDYASTVGLLSQTLQGKNLVASLAGQDVVQAILGYEMMIAMVKRR